MERITENFDGQLYIGRLTPSVNEFVLIVMRVHLFPFRTQKLSSCTPTIVAGWLAVKIGNANTKNQASAWFFFFYAQLQFFGNHTVLLGCQKFFRKLDKNAFAMVKYFGNLRGTERVPSGNLQRVWVIGCKPGQERCVKVRPGAEISYQVINESGTADQYCPPLMPSGIRGVFYL